MNKTLQIRIILVLIVFNTIQVGIALVWSVNRSHAGSKPVAILINNDASIRHQQNIDAARAACQKYGVEPIVIQCELRRLPGRKQIQQAFQSIERDNQRLVLVYLTGHGSLLFSGEEKPTSTIHFNDGPLAPSDIANHLPGDCVVYIDVCFAPGWVNALADQLDENVMILSDKPYGEQQRSCRGTSQLLWGRMMNEPEKSFKDSFVSAWKDTCPGGASNQ